MNKAKSVPTSPEGEHSRAAHASVPEAPAIEVSVVVLLCQRRCSSIQRSVYVVTSGPT